MAANLTVSIDAMGGDTGPGIVVTALARSSVRHPSVRFLLHGDEAVLKPLFAKRAKLLERVEIRHSAERVRMEDKPSQALRRGRNTSMWRCIESVKNKEAQVAISGKQHGRLDAASCRCSSSACSKSIDRPCHRGDPGRRSAGSPSCSTSARMWNAMRTSSLISR